MTRMLWPILCMVCIGCAGTRSPSPYASDEPELRSTVKAEQLNRRALEVMETTPELAEQLLRQALAADLYYGPAHNNLGVLHLHKGSLYEAAGEFEWARKLMPGLPDPRMNLALTLERAGRTDESMNTYRTALEVYPGHIHTVQALVRLQVKANRMDETTPGLLSEVALRGVDESWRHWARLQMASRGDTRNADLLK